MRKDPRPAFDSFPLKIVNKKFDLDQDPSSKSYDDHLQLNEPQEIKTNPIASVHTPIPCKTPDRLPPISHAFPKNHYLYLPRFNGDYENITAERHVLNFVYFLNLFEVDEEDISIRLFALSS